MNVNRDDQTRQFLALWTESARRIFAFILTVLPNWNDAEDLLQDTSALLWERFDQYRPGSDFVAWGCRVAYLKVLEFRRSRKKAVCFTDSLTSALSDLAQRESDSLSLRGEALVDCMQKLAQRDHELITLRYTPGATVRSVAAQINKSVDATYKALNRVHDQLFDCVQTTLREEEGNR
jgi:RNA polymerase sigma-70 factor, ECF subfamily